jgi:hypothetical protein
MSAEAMEQLAAALQRQQDALINIQEQNATVHQELVARLNALTVRTQNQQQNAHGDEDRDDQGRTPAQANRAALDFIRHCPTFERGKDRWSDFSARFELQKDTYGIDDANAKVALWNAISGKSSRIVIASMQPRQTGFDTMSFAQYLTAMGAKFTPASESMQMKSEYKARVQGKNEDVQNYLNEKYELYKVAYPGANDMADFYMEATKGVANKYVRNNLWGYRANSVENYGEMAVYWVQVERQRVAFGDSDSTTMEGLVPVTRNVTNNRPEMMEVDHLRRVDQDHPGEDDELDGCECMALHDQGFRGPCFYCQKRGHMIRNCPRKSAGLARVKDPNKVTTNPQKGPAQKPKWNPAKKGNAPYQQKRFKRVNNIDNDEEEDPEDEVTVQEDAEDEDEEVSFLGEMAL